MADAIDAAIAVELVSGKWIPPVIVALSTGPHRYARLSQALGQQVARKVLIETLRRMEDSRLVTRHMEFDDGQLSVRYVLTQRGRSLLPVIAGLAKWTRADTRTNGTGRDT